MEIFIFILVFKIRFPANKNISGVNQKHNTEDLP